MEVFTNSYIIITAVTIEKMIENDPYCFNSFFGDFQNLHCRQLGMDIGLVRSKNLFNGRCEEKWQFEPTLPIKRHHHRLQQ